MGQPSLEPVTFPSNGLRLSGTVHLPARDSVTQYEEAFRLVRHARPPIELHLRDGTDHFMFVNADPRVASTLRSWLNRFFPARRAEVSC